MHAVVSLYGVTDLFDLAATTHRFESRYLDRLVGPLPGAADQYRTRSPVAHAHEITVPALVLQGADDKVVPPAQAQLLVDSMRTAGATVEHHVYDGRRARLLEGRHHRRLPRPHRPVPHQVGGATMTELVTEDRG